MCVGFEAEIFEQEDHIHELENCHGILVPGGFGERGAEGKIQAAQFARRRKVIFWNCFGMQMAVIEARNLAGIPEANSTEFGYCKDRSRPAYRMDARQHCGTA